MLNVCSFSCSMRMPPWLCVIALGSPVVPEENRTHSGWPNGTCSNSNSGAGTGGGGPNPPHAPGPGGAPPAGPGARGPPPQPARQRRGLRLVVERIGFWPLAPQHVLRVVQPGPGEPLGPGHAPAAEDRGRRRRGLDAAVIPDRLPEAVEIGHGPAPQRGIAVTLKVEPPLAGQPPDERGDVGAGGAVRSRRPQQVTLANLALRLHIADGAIACRKAQDV